MKVLTLNLYNYFPLGYVFQSRIITKAERISWFLIFPLFLFIPVLIIGEGYLNFLLIFLSLLSAYEIGYLYNDVITTRTEKSPTLRSSKFQEDNLLYCVLIRFFFSFLISSYFYFSGNLGISIYVAFSFIVVNLLFFIHNNVRSRFNVLTYFLLVASRYIFPSLLFCSYIQVFIIVLIFPVCRTIEHACKVKYNLTSFQYLVGNPDVFRVKYLSILFFIVVFFVGDSTSTILVSYFLVLRILSLSVSKIEFFNRNKHSSY